MPPPNKEFWLRCGGKPAAERRAGKGWCSIPVGNREEAQIRAVTIETHPRPKPRPLETSGWVWTWRGRGAEAAQESPGQRGALQEEGPGESQGLGALERTPGHRCQESAGQGGKSEQWRVRDKGLPEPFPVEPLGEGYLSACTTAPPGSTE